MGWVVAVALAWSTAPILTDLLARTSRADPPRATDGPPPAVTTLIRVGDEPDDVVRASVLTTVGEGPAAIVTTADRRVPAELADVVAVHRGDTVAAAIASAMRCVESEAVHLVSARAIPRPSRSRDAARHLGGRVAWVCGSSRPFTRDGFAPGGRDLVGARLRGRARRAGLDLWEPDATLVRSDVLRDHPLPEDRPWGSWLRERRDDGWSGEQVERTLALRTTPLDAESFWPDTIARQRAAAADLSSALGRGGPRVRAIALGLLLRELYVVGVVGWLVVPVLLGTSGDFPFTLPAGTSISAIALLCALRWATARGALGVALRPSDDLLAALHHLPGSAAAIPSALTRRVTAGRAPIPTRPLVWAALLLTVLAGSTLIDRDPAAPVSKVAVSTSLGALALLWAFAMRAMVQRGWQRRIHRTPVELEVSLDGIMGHTVDASPTGLAVRLPEPLRGVRAGDDVTLSLRLDDGGQLAMTGTIATTRTTSTGTVVGLAVDPSGVARAAWLAQVLRAADRTTPGDGVPIRSPHHQVSTSPAPRGGGWRPRARGVLDRSLHALVALCTASVVALLVLALLGFRPLVIRSGSMVPTLGVGDVILSEQVPASMVEVGQVVTQPERHDGEEALTHRVVRVEDLGDALRIETLGDANDRSETWTVTPDHLVGVQRGTIPWVGRIATGVRTSAAQMALCAAVVALVVAATLGRRRPTQIPAPA